MATNYFIGTTGSVSWADATKWSLGAAPVNTNDVVVNSGSCTIDSGLSQSAVTLASLTVGPNFIGSIGAPATPLAIGISGTVIINTQSTQVCIDQGSTTPAWDVIQTGPNSNTPPIFGTECLIVQGGGAGCTMAIAGANTNVGIATQTATTTAQIDTWKINGGYLNINTGVTWTTGVQSASNGVGGNTTGGLVTVLSAGTTITQNGLNCQLVTGGAVKITTLVIAGQAILNNRPASGAGWDTLTIGPGAQADCSQDPRSATITNSIIMASGSTFTAFSAGQITKVSTGILTISPQTTGVGNPGINVNVGNVATATFA